MQEALRKHDETQDTWPQPADYVAGTFLKPEEELPNTIQDPNTGRDVQKMAATSPVKLEEALAAAWACHRSGAWSSLGAHGRAEKLEEIAIHLSRDAEEIAQRVSRSTGLVITRTRSLCRLLPAVFRAAAKQAVLGQTSYLPGAFGSVEVIKAPLGPALCITPWNAPAVIAAHKVASALAAGCPAILKPSEWASSATDRVAEAVIQAGLPEGAFQLVHGGSRVGAQLVEDRRIKAVSFTGGLAGGRAIGRACSEQMKPAQLELGGNNPMVVLRGADLDAAARGVVTALTEMNGQWCRALGRLLVDEAVEIPLLERVGERLEALRIGPSFEDSSEMGPLIHHGHKAAMQSAVRNLQERGGTVFAPSRVPSSGGHFFAPTLVTGCRPADTAEEIFGPVAAVHTFRTEQEAMEMVHQTPYGLAAYVFGREEDALSFSRRIEAGMVKVNGVTLTSLNPAAPRDAWGLSGLGIEGAEETYSFFTGYRVVGVAGRGK